MTRKIVHDSGHQWCLGADDGQTDVILSGELHQCREIQRVDGDVLNTRFQMRTSVARCDEDAASLRGLAQAPGQRVFAAAISNNHYIHLRILCNGVRCWALVTAFSDGL